MGNKNLIIVIIIKIPRETVRDRSKTAVGLEEIYSGILNLSKSRIGGAIVQALGGVRPDQQIQTIEVGSSLSHYVVSRTKDF